MIRVSIIGATGYVGMEMVRLLAVHPEIELTTLVSQSFVGKKYSDIYPNLRGICDIVCSDLDADLIASSSDLVITALPHGVSQDIIPLFLDKGIKVLDHSGDFRYKNANVYEKWYKITHKLPHLLQEAVYGLPELYRDKIKDARLVANPGCYPTCSILALAPLLKNSIIKSESIIINAASGISGAGRKSDLAYSFCESQDNFKPYGIASHRHTSEIEQELSFLAGKDVLVSFTPHLLPIKRGMLCTTYADLNKKIDTASLIELVKEFYKNEYFIRVLDKGVPEIKNVAGSNFIDIGLTVDERVNRVILVSAHDNLGKGSAAQAVQDINIMCGFDEKTGLINVPHYL